MVESQNTTGSNTRIALFAEDSRIYPEELQGLIRVLVAAGQRVRCYAPDWPDHVAKLAVTMGAETDTFPIQPDDTWRLMPGRALQKDIATKVTDWAPSVAVAIGPFTAALILPNLGNAIAHRVVILDRWAMDDDAPESLPPERLLKAAELKSILRASDTVVCHTANDAHKVGEAVAALLRKTPHPAIRTIPAYGAPTGACTLTDLPPLDEPIIFLLTSPLDRWKGVAEFAEAARLLKSRGANVAFHLQAAPARTADRVARSDLETNDAVKLVDPSLSLQGAIANSHVLVLASHHDGMPRELLNALALGRPIIAADLPGPREAIDQIVNGCLFEPGNAESLASACASFASRPNLFPAMARASRLKAERRFPEDAALRAYLDVFHVNS